RPPTLRSGMCPEEHSFSTRSEIPDSAHQVRRPDPSPRKEHDGINPIVRFHLLQRRSRFFLRGNDKIVLHQFDSGLNQRLLRSTYNGIVNERDSHWILEPVLVHTVNNESDRRLNQRSSQFSRLESDL